MNNILETNLHLTHSPISIKDFNRIKKSPVLNTELWREKESLDNASLYIIGKREAPVFVPRREISDEHCLILDVEVGKASFRIFIPALTNPKYSLNGFAGIKTEPEGLEKAQKVWLFAFNDKGEAVPNIGFTFDELIYYASNDLFHIEIQGDFTSAITYDVLYVGETVREKLTQRFKAHHALQDMLIEEKVISPSFDKSEELILMPFTIDSYMCSSVMEGYSGTGLFSFRNNSINLICIISEECGDNSSGTLLRATSSEKCRELLELTNLHSEYPRSFERYKELAGFTFPSSRSKAKRLFYDFSEELMEDCDLLPENCVEKWYDELSCKSDRKKCDKFWTGKLELMAILYGSGFVSGANVTKPVINMPDPYENDQVEVEYICTEDETESVLGRLIEAEYFAKRGKLKNGTLFVLNSNNGRFFLYPRHECRAIVRDITACAECSNRALKNKLGQFLPENSKESENFDIIDGAAIHCNLAAISVDRMLDLMSRNKIDKCLLQENMAGVLKELWEL